MMRIEDFTQYLLWEKKYSPHTVEAYGTDLSEFEGFLVSMQAPVEDASIDFQAVRAWVVHLMEQGYTPSSVNRKISALRSYFKYLLRRGAIRISPMMRQGNLKEPIPYDGSVFGAGDAAFARSGPVSRRSGRGAGPADRRAFLRLRAALRGTLRCTLGRCGLSAGDVAGARQRGKERFGPRCIPVFARRLGNTSGCLRAGTM